MKKLLVIVALFAGQTCALRAVEKENLRSAILNSRVSEVKAALEFREEYAVTDLQMYREVAQEVVTEREKLVFTDSERLLLCAQGALGAFSFYKSITMNNMFLQFAAFILGDYAYAQLRAPMIRLTNAKTILYALGSAVEKRKKAKK